MIDQSKTGQQATDPTKANAPQPGHFLKEEDTDADVKPGDVHDESDGMEKPDFLGKTNLENRDEESLENK